MLWFWITILAFLFLAIASLFDRYFLAGPIPKPTVYTFYLGGLTFLFSFLILPIVLYFNINIWNKEIIFFGICAGIGRLVAIFFMNQGIINSGVSRVVPAIGGFTPIFSLLFFYLYSPEETLKTPLLIAAIILLAAGSLIIAAKKIKEVFLLNNLKYSLLSAFFFALTFFLIKILFSISNFLGGIYLMCIASGIVLLPLIISKKFNNEIFSHKVSIKVSNFFVLGQVFGAVGVISQFYAVYLAKANQVPLINAMEGLKYIFLFALIFILSIWKPKILNENFRGDSLALRIFATILICLGLSFLYLA